MKTTIKTTLLVVTWASQLTNAQLFGDKDSLGGSWYDQLGLSKACVDVYNTHVSCDKALASATNL